MAQLLNPILRWAGSKRQILHRLCPFWNHKFKRYIEPFSGSAALFFAINPAKALLADINMELIDTYEIIRDEPKKLFKSLSKYPRSKEVYLKFRAMNVNSLTKFGKALRFIYLNRFCFNGIYRTNRKGQFNVPYSPIGTGGMPNYDHFIGCSVRLQNAELKNWDFQKTLAEVRAGDFIYLDPPYAVEDRRIFCEYGPKPFTKADLVRLIECLNIVDERGGKFLLSYAYSSKIKSLFENWKIKRHLVKRNVAGFAGSRRNSYEILVTNIINSEGQ